MTALPDAIAALPDEALVPIRWVKQVLAEAPTEPSQHRVLTTGEAADQLGYSSPTWREWCEAGEIDGAYRDEGEAGMWRLPLPACLEHLARLQSKALNRRRKRGPWKKAGPSAQTARAGTGADTEGTLVFRRPSPVGRRAPDDAGPEGGRLA